MGKSVDYPEPPDPVATANAQGALNRETAITQAELNMVDQQGPFGSLTYQRLPGEQTRQFDQAAYDKALEQWSTAGGSWQDVWVPGDEGGTTERRFVPGPGGGKQPQRSDFYYMEDVGTPRYRAVTTLSPEQQGLYQGQMGLQQSLLDVGNDQLGRVSSALAQPLNLQGIPQAATGLPGSVARLPQQYKIDAAGAIDQGAPQYSQNRQNIGAVGPIQRSVGADDFGDDRMRVEQALMQRMQPYLDQRREQERTRLVNQGFADPGSQGYSTAMDEVYRAENDARLAAILNAGDEQSRLFGMDVTAGQFANAAQQQAYDQAAGRVDRSNANIDANLRNDIAAQQAQNLAQQQLFDQQAARAAFYNQAQAQNFGQNVTQNQAAFDLAAYQNALRDRAIQERMLLRQTPINEISALTSGAQVQLPQFVNTPQTGIQAPDLQGATYAAYQGQLANAQARQQQNQALTQGLFSLGGAGLGAFGAINPFKWGVS